MRRETPVRRKGHREIFLSAGAAASYLGIDIEQIYSTLRGETKHADGFQWEYVSDAMLRRERMKEAQEGAML